MSEYESLLKSGRLRPVRGSLIGVKYRPDLVDAGEGVGMIKGDLTESGLVVVAKMDEAPEDALLASTAVVVRALGEDPERWRSRFQNLEWDHRTGWADQKIEAGTIVFARGVAQAPLGPDSDYVQLRYDDIAGVAVPLDEPGDIPARPAPGFVLVKKSEYGGRIGSIILKEDYAEVLSEGAGARGTVAALPRGDTLAGPDGVRVGMEVTFPRYSLSEYVDLEGGFRLLPYEDVLTVET